MKDICPHNDCTGCALCAFVCPKACITMRPGALGHMYPHIDASGCIDCGACVRTCPSAVSSGFVASAVSSGFVAFAVSSGFVASAVSSVSSGSAASSSFAASIRSVPSAVPGTAFAAWAKDSGEYLSSASGGAASVLSRLILSDGGVVYGSTAGSDGSGRFGIRHIRVDSEDDLWRLKGSKYVHSSITGVLSQLRDDVRGGRPVLFTGMPCQAVAVRKMFPDEPENLLIVDLVCHGVPSEAFFLEYVRKNLKISLSSVSSVTFRDGDEFRMTVKGEDGKVLYTHRPLSGLRIEDLYYNLFMDGFTYRDSCYRCPYAGMKRVSDMTIGDFWGLDKSVPAPGHGVSLILPVTDKGKRFAGRLAAMMTLVSRPVGEAAAGNDQLRSPRHRSIRIRLFRRLEKIFGPSVYYVLVFDLMLRRRLKYKKKFAAPKNNLRP